MCSFRKSSKDVNPIAITKNGSAGIIIPPKIRKPMTAATTVPTPATTFFTFTTNFP